MNTEIYTVGDIVTARFTNSGRIREFRGLIVGKTKNYWKVQAITSPYAGEAPGRVFHVYTPEARQYSANNRIVGFADR
jgi:hypothetical protein